MQQCHMELPFDLLNKLYNFLMTYMAYSNNGAYYILMTSRTVNLVASLNRLGRLCLAVPTFTDGVLAGPVAPRPTLLPQLPRQEPVAGQTLVDDPPGE